MILNNEIVAILGLNKNSNIYDISFFCEKINTSIKDSDTILMNYFLTNFDYKEINYLQDFRFPIELFKNNEFQKYKFIKPKYEKLKSNKNCFKVYDCGYFLKKLKLTPPIST
jgi:hypothetical protein